MADGPSELVPKTDKRQLNPDLTPQQLQAAMLEGFGYNHPEVGAVVGVSKQTVQRWGREVEGYADAVQIYSERNVQAIEPLVARVKTEIVEAAFEAFASLREALHAETLDGSPRWPVRNEAAALILTHLKLVTGESLAVTGPSQGSSDEGGGSSPRSVEIVINAPQQPVTVDQPPAAEEEEPIEADVVEDAQA